MQSGGLAWFVRVARDAWGLRIAVDTEDGGGRPTARERTSTAPPPGRGGANQRPSLTREGVDQPSTGDVRFVAVVI